MSIDAVCPEDVHRAVELWINLWRLCKTSCCPQLAGIPWIFSEEIGCISL